MMQQPSQPQSSNTFQPQAQKLPSQELPSHIIGQGALKEALREQKTLAQKIEEFFSNDENKYKFLLFVALLIALFLILGDLAFILL